MRIRAEREKLSADQVATLVTSPEVGNGLWESTFAIDLGREYEVYGMYLHHGMIWVYVADDFGSIRVAPLCLFGILDGAVPASWKVSVDGASKIVFIAPPGASHAYFADMVDEGEPLATSTWRSMLADTTEAPAKP